ncbi:uncharacterized protein M6G45_011393 isoform 2-T2 [Spheniscus humboldti]
MPKFCTGAEHSYMHKADFAHFNLNISSSLPPRGMGRTIGNNQECAECLNSLSCPQSPQSPEHSKCQRGKREQNGPQELRVHSSFTTLQASTALSYATQPSCLLPQTQQKARYGNIRAFNMQEMSAEG